MCVQKEVKTYVDSELNVEGVTLLSVEEVKKIPKAIRSCSSRWWLRSPGDDDNFAAFLYGEYGYVGVNGIIVEKEFGVRPALKFNPSSANHQIKDKVMMFGYNWTVISDSLMLCDNIVGDAAFRKDSEARDANVYEASDVKKWLENWYAERLKAQAV